MTQNIQQFEIIDTKLAEQKDSFKEIILTLLLSVSIACFFIIPITSYLINQDYKTTVTNLAEGMQTRAVSKFHILDSQFNSLFDYSNSITNSDTIKLLLADYAISPENELITAQTPYIKRTIQEFVDFNDEIVSATLTANNKTLAEYNTYEFLNQPTPTFIFENNKAVSSFIINNDNVFVDVAVNIKDLNYSQEANIVGQLVYRLNITDKLTKTLSETTNALKGSQNVLTYTNEAGLTKQLALKGTTLSKVNYEKDQDAFSNNISQTINNKILIATTKLNAYGYTIQFVYNKDDALKNHTIFKANTFSYSALLLLIISLFILAFFWKGKNKQTRALAKQYGQFAKEINKKQTMLEGINTTIDEHITLKDLNGKFIYANQAFNKFFNVSTSIKRLNLVDYITNKNLQTELKKADESIAKNLRVWSKDQVEIASKNGTRYFDITKWPQKDGEDITGIITIARDRTETILHQKEMEKLQNQAINALVQTVEIKDPHLAGHHARLAYIAKEIANKLKLTDEEKLTLDYSARLSGIGKVFVPQALLTKPGKLTADELEIIQTHVVKATEVLNKIDFSLPVVDTISSMYERLDGSGYPEAKTAEHINQLARILAVADAFCALIVPRSYRDAIEFNEAVKLLESQYGKYDPEVLATLTEIVKKLSSVKKDFIINLK